MFRINEVLCAQDDEYVDFHKTFLELVNLKKHTLVWKKLWKNWALQVLSLYKNMISFENDINDLFYIGLRKTSSFSWKLCLCRKTLFLCNVVFFSVKTLCSYAILAIVTHFVWSYTCRNSNIHGLYWVFLFTKLCRVIANIIFYIYKVSKNISWLQNLFLSAIYDRQDR